LTDHSKYDVDSWTKKPPEPPPLELPAVYTTIASADCDPFPRPFTGDPYEAAAPLIARLREVLGCWKGDNFGSKSNRLRAELFALAAKVPDWHNVVFAEIVASAMRQFGNRPIHAAFRIESEDDRSFANTHGVAFHRRGTSNYGAIDKIAKSLVGPLMEEIEQVTRTHGGSLPTLVAARFPDYTPVNDVLIADVMFDNKLPVRFYSNLTMGLLWNEFRVAVTVRIDGMRHSEAYEVDWKRLEL